MTGGPTRPPFQHPGQPFARRADAGPREPGWGQLTAGNSDFKPETSQERRGPTSSLHLVYTPTRLPTTVLFLGEHTAQHFAGITNVAPDSRPLPHLRPGPAAAQVFSFGR